MGSTSYETGIAPTAAETALAREAQIEAGAAVLLAKADETLGVEFDPDEDDDAPEALEIGESPL